MNIDINIARDEHEGGRKRKREGVGERREGRLCAVAVDAE